MKIRFYEQRFALAIIAPAAIIVFGTVLVPLLTTLVYSLKNMELLSENRGAFCRISKLRTGSHQP